MVWNLKRFCLPVLMAALTIPACTPALAQKAPPPRPPVQKKFHMPFGRWWDNPHMAQSLALTSEQRKKMDEIFNSYRPKLESLHSNLHKQEAMLGPLIGARDLNKGKILAQFDAVVEAHGNLEREFDRFFLAIRSELTYDQWQKLAEMHREQMERMKHHHWKHGPKGPHGPPPPKM